MSSRALRKLQRQQQRHLQHTEPAKPADGSDGEDNATDDDEEQPFSPVQRPRNAFDVLGDEDGDGDGHGDEEDGSEADVAAPSSAVATIAADDADADAESSQKTAKKAKKKKKKKKKKAAQRPETAKESSGDEIDRALREINAANARAGPSAGDNDDDDDDDDDDENSHQLALSPAQAADLLGINQKNLNPTAEMRGLFGNVALEGEQTLSGSGGGRGSAVQQRRRGQHQHGPVDLATGLTGRYTVASRGRELGTLAQRPNPLVQAKADWPLAPSGGLSMELLSGVGTAPEKHYRVVHNAAYQESQFQFLAVVESMDPQRLIGLLSLTPYHIATLLQVSEICKHQGDHALSGDLLERALFSFGRSLHSSFPLAMRHGLARLPFAEPANRELYLAVWRYIRNLEMRGTWKTAFEWAKLLLQLDPRSDPYGVTLMIDQLALAGRSHQQLLRLADDTAYGPAWRHLPNIQISLALAQLRDRQPRAARRQLAIAMHQYPYILSALASALDISPVPKALWGKLPADGAQKLYTELYLHRCKTLWNTPEASALLVEVADSLPYYSAVTATLEPPPKLEISLEEARHVLMLEVPALIALLPRKFTTMPTSSSDPLPPPSSVDQSAFTLRQPAAAAAITNPLQSILDAAGAAAGSANSALQRFATWFSAPATAAAGAADNAENRAEGEQAFHQLQAELGQDVPPEVLEQLLHLQLAEAAAAPEPATTAPAAAAAADEWDHYADLHDNASDRELSNDDDDDGDDSLSSTLEQEHRHPLAATVEDDISDSDAGDDGPRPWTTHTGAVLRRVESDDDEEGTRSQPRQQQQQQQQQQPTSHSTPQGDEEDPGLEADPQRLQRWLLTTGLANLLRSTPTSGTSPAMDLYIRRLTHLRKAQQNWILSMIKQQQRAGGPDARQIVAHIERRLL